MTRLAARKTPKTATRFIAVLALGASTAAMAQADEPWEGMWETEFGPVRLIQEGDRVYGDYYNTYQNEASYIDARVSEDGRVLRGTWQKTRNRTDNGFIEFSLTGDGWVGDYQYTHNTRAPDWQGGRWNGTLISRATPKITVAVDREHYFNDDFFRTVGRLRDWTFFGQPVDVASADLWGRGGLALPAGTRDQIPSRPDLDVRPRPNQTVRPMERPEIRFPGEMHTPDDDGGEQAFPGEMHTPEPDDEQAFPGEMHSPEPEESARDTVREVETRIERAGGILRRAKGLLGSVTSSSSDDEGDER